MRDIFRRGNMHTKIIAALNDLYIIRRDKYLLQNRGKTYTRNKNQSQAHFKNIPYLTILCF